MARVAAGALIGIAEGNPEWLDVPEVIEFPYLPRIIALARHPSI